MATIYTAHRSTKRMLILIGLVLVLGGLMIVVDVAALLPESASGFRSQGRLNALERISQILPWIGYAAVAIALLLLPTVFRKRIEFAINEEGITYPPALGETLPWERIERLAVRKMVVAPVLSVWIRDADTFPIKNMARRIAEMNKNAGDFGDINIETQRSDGDFEQLIAAVERHRTVER